MVVADDGQWGLVSGVPAVTPVPRILFSGTGHPAVFHPLSPAATREQGPAFSCLFGFLPPRLGCLLNANPSLATVISQALFHTGLGCVVTELFRNGGEEKA